MKLGEVAEYSKERISTQQLTPDNFIGVDNLLPERKGKTESSHIPATGKVTAYGEKDILIGNIRPYLKKIWFANNKGGASGDVLVLHAIDKNVLPEYLFQVLADDAFFHYNMLHAKGAKMPRGNKESILLYPIPIPSLAEQERIVAILDRFDTLTNSIAEGLPREIELRHQQYVFYRDALLNFPK